MVGLALRAFEGERRVGQVLLELHFAGVSHPVHRLRADLQHAAPTRWQGRQYAAIAVALLEVLAVNADSGFSTPGNLRTGC